MRRRSRRRCWTRIVRASSRPGDRVGDFFAGSGTTGVVAARLDRNATLVDRNPVAVEKTLLRLARLAPRPRVNLWRYFSDDRRRTTDGRISLISVFLRPSASHFCSWRRAYGGR